jgi:Ca2+-binding RTX toxin-like protein
MFGDGSLDGKLYGLAGDDYRVGGSGKDTLDGGTEADTMFGGAGNDTYYVDNAGDVVREDSVVGVDDGGVDLVSASVSFTLGAFVDNLTLTGSAAIDGTGNDLANNIKGNGAVNHLTGGAGADVLTGNGGADLLDGGDDGDSYIVDFSDIIHDTGSSGTDKVQSAGTYVLAAGSGIEQLTTKAGVVGGNLTGDEGANIITGNTGANILTGKAGNDTLSGGAGTDTLIGGLDRDRMTGGADADTFRFALGDSLATAVGFDTVVDFETGIDRMDLTIFVPASAYAEITVASNVFATLKTTAEAQMVGGVKAVFVAGSANGWLFWNTDATPGTAEEAVLLAGMNSLSAFALGDLM